MMHTKATHLLASLLPATRPNRTAVLDAAARVDRQNPDDALDPGRPAPSQARAARGMTKADLFDFDFEDALDRVADRAYAIVDAPLPRGVDAATLEADLRRRQKRVDRLFAAFAKRFPPSEAG